MYEIMRKKKFLKKSKNKLFSLLIVAGKQMACIKMKNAGSEKLRCHRKFKHNISKSLV